MKTLLDTTTVRRAIWSAVVLGCVALAAPAGAADAKFATIGSPLDGYQTEDLGVVDVNGDGWLDVFSTHHDFAASLRLGDAGGGFADVSAAWGFGIDPDLPGLEAAWVVLLHEGLHAFFKGHDLVVRRHGAALGDPPLRGRVVLPRRTEWVTDRSMFPVSTDPPSPPSTRAGRSRVVEFESRGDGQLRFLPVLPMGPISLEVEDTVPLAAIRVGRDGLPATSHTTRLFRLDRHGMAWSDFDADGDMDVFVNAGAVRGMAPPSVNDELLVNRDGRFRDGAGAAGIVKNGARGRRVEWVDHDGDGRLDAYTGNFKSANRLWAQTAERRFVDRAPALGLDLSDGDRFRWFDADGDGDADLLVAGRGGPARLFRNLGDGFRAESIADSATNDPRQLILADVEPDGDVDVLIVDGESNRLLLAKDGGFAADAARRGLPERALAAAWVDFDNDGMMDLHAVPAGLFRQLPDGRFDLVALRANKEPEDARCVWFDLDNDGDRDGLCDHNLGYFPVAHLIHRNDAPPAHRLEIDLVGPPGNAQAIGASVVIETTPGRRSAHVVGEADSSHFSLGHYRIYAGLGAAERVAAITVTWPGGKTQRVDGVAADERLVVRYETEAVNREP